MRRYNINKLITHHQLPVCLIVLFFITTSCQQHKKLITDEIVLKDQNSLTGTIINCDSLIVTLKKSDESKQMIQWRNIDTIIGKKYKTIWFGLNTGYYNIPYFSVFKNEPMTAKDFGMQLKIGRAIREKKMQYISWMFSNAKPYSITKLGVGFQRYIGKGTYINQQGFFWGSEFNMMNAKYNNGAQLTLEPFAGYEHQILDQWRVNFKMGLQFNIANKNNNAGINFTIGLHYLKRNFNSYYTKLNTEHKLPKN